MTKQTFKKIVFILEHGKITTLLPKRTFKMIVLIRKKEDLIETSCKENCQRDEETIVKNKKEHEVPKNQRNRRKP